MHDVGVLVSALPIVIVVPVLDLLDGAPDARRAGVDEIATIRRYTSLLVARMRSPHPGVPVDVRYMRDAADVAALLATNDLADPSVGRLAARAAAIAAELWVGPAWRVTEDRPGAVGRERDRAADAHDPTAPRAS